MQNFLQFQYKKVKFVFLLSVDSIVERRALRESVFPKLREHCRCTLGLDVRVSKHITFHMWTVLQQRMFVKVLMTIFSPFWPFKARNRSKPYVRNIYVH